MILYISVHKVVRELDGKLFFALKAAKRGSNSVVGRKAEMLELLMRGPAGKFFDTRMNQSRISVRKKNHSRLRRKGHEVWLFDEEVTSIDDTKVYEQNQISKQVISSASKIFAWSDFHGDMLKNVDANAKFYVVGHPRYDLYDGRVREIYIKEAENLKKTYKNYILIPSSFGDLALCDNESLDLKVEVNTRKGFFKSKEDSHLFKDKVNYRRETAKIFMRDIVKLARKYKDTNFVLRPHFVETTDMWAPLLNSGLSNIHVVHKGPIAPWLYGATGIIHHHCSTAVEAFLFDKPVISYIPIQDKRFERFLPAAVSSVVNEFEDLVVAVGNMITGKAINKKNEVSIDLDYYIKNNNERLASDQILDVVQESQTESQYDEIEDAKRFFLSLEKKPGFLSVLSALKRIKKHEGEPRITLQLLTERLKLFTAVDPEFERCQVRQIGDELFYISAGS